jgi:hypothetical protein
VDVLTFISEIIKALAWPATVITLLILVRKELPAIAKSLRRLKFKGVELEFGDAAKAIATEAKDALPKTPTEGRLFGQPKEEMANKITAIAEIAPRAAILEAWLQVEAAAADLVRKRDIAKISPTSGPMRLRNMLVRIDALNPKQIAIYENLRRLRNQAVHVPEAQFTPESVKDYIDTALNMATYLEGLGQP